VALLQNLVTSPNFRRPAPLAKDLLSIDDISDGRLIVGIGSGGLGAMRRFLAKTHGHLVSDRTIRRVRWASR
jgi:alkanesulfonate monooxygenase SsuD/methylene tetrahydromethanopterin reductase-like flavin-dependent oxidoreductase (luciferase family)